MNKNTLLWARFSCAMDTEKHSVPLGIFCGKRGWWLSTWMVAAVQEVMRDVVWC